MSTEINHLTFSELCTRIKKDYGDKLPDDAYDSPESLVLAMKSIQEEEHLFGYKNGSGYFRYPVSQIYCLE